jgi:hypothetical protein
LIPAASVTLAYINTATNAIDVAGISSLFPVGTTSEVSYESLADDGANSIGGLTNEAFYDLKAVDANSFQPFNETTGQVVQLSDPGGPATQALSYISHVVNFNPIAVTINSAGQPVDANGNVVSGGVDSIPSCSAPMPSIPVTTSSFPATALRPATGSNITTAATPRSAA